MTDRSHDFERSRRINPTVWGVRIVSAAMLVVGIFVLWQRYRPVASQDELVRFSTLTVPGYLEELARLHALIDRLGAPGLAPADARVLLVDDLMPTLIRMRKRAEGVQTDSPTVHDSNAEYMAALDAYMDMDRAAVRTIDDPSAGPEAARAFPTKRREADDQVRAFVANLKRRCEQAGINVVPGGRR